MAVMAPTAEFEGEGEVEPTDVIKENIKEQFKLCDLGKTGAISRWELVQVLRTLDSSYWTLSRVDDVFDSMDSNRDGQIHIDEFVDWVFANADDDTPAFFTSDEVEQLQSREKVEDDLELDSASSSWLVAAGCSACGPRPQNEDQHILLCDWKLAMGGSVGLFAVFDGHGGHSVSILASRMLVRTLKTHMEALCERTGGDWASTTPADRRALLEDVFLEVDKVLSKKEVAVDCGSTCVAALVWPDSSQACENDPDERPFRVLLANIGDSRGLVVRRAAGFGPRAQSVCCAELLGETQDHKPDDEAERRRIEAAGGEVMAAGARGSFRGFGPPRVDGDLALSRAFGDFRFKRESGLDDVSQKVIALPDIYEYGCKRGDFLVLACDGAFDVLSSDEVARLVHNNLRPPWIAKAAVRWRAAMLPNVSCGRLC
jgi:serine/threonine protein phosphatase PrpC